MGLGFFSSPSFFSLPAACRIFSRGVIFTRALLSLRKNGGLLVVYQPLDTLSVVVSSLLQNRPACCCLSRHVLTVPSSLARGIVQSWGAIRGVIFNKSALSKAGHFLLKEFYSQICVQ